MNFATTPANPNFPNNPGYNLYKGARYVPKFSDQPGSVWTNTIKYEPLTIVLWEGNSYTSKTFVPVGVDISNEVYWAQTGNYNAQVEQYRKEVEEVKKEIDNLTLTNWVNPIYFGAVGDGVTDDGDAIVEASKHGSLLGDNEHIFYIGHTISLTDVNMKNMKIKYDNNLQMQFSANYFTIDNCYFEMPLSEAQKPAIDRGDPFLRMSGCNYGEITNCHFHRGLWLGSINGCHNIKFYGNTFDNVYQTHQQGNGYGFLVNYGSTNISFINNNFFNIMRHAIYLTNDGVELNNHIIISNNTFDNSGTPEIPNTFNQYPYMIANRATSDVLISNNLFNEVWGAVVLTNFTHQTDNEMYDINIVNNIIRGNMPDNNQPMISFATTTKMPKNVNIIGNIIENCFYGIDTCDLCLIANNNITSTKAAFHFKGIDNTRICNIISNAVFGSDYAITASPTENTFGTLVFKDNYFKTINQSLDLDGVTLTNLIVQNNFFDISYGIYNAAKSITNGFFSGNYSTLSTINGLLFHITNLKKSFEETFTFGESN